MEDDSSIRTRRFLAVPQGEGRRGETGRLALIMYLKFMYRNAHVQRTRWDAQNDRMDQRQKEWNDRKMCAWLVNECMNGTKCEMSKTSPWRALLERVLSTLFYMDYGEKPRTHHAHMHPVCSGTSSQSWRSGDITRKLGHFNVISPNQKIKKKKKKNPHYHY